MSRDGFRTAKTLTDLVSVLEILARKDELGFYFGEESVAKPALQSMKAHYPHVTLGQINHCLTILVFLKVIEKGRPGRRPQGYKRRFYPRQITEQDIRQFRDSLKPRWRR